MISDGAQKLLTTAILLPDGVGLRNFVLGPFLSEVGKLGPVHAFHLVEDDVLNTYAGQYRDTVTWHRLLELVEYPWTNILRRALAFAQMYWVDTPPMHGAGQAGHRQAEISRRSSSDPMDRTALRLASRNALARAGA